MVIIFLKMATIAKQELVSRTFSLIEGSMVLVSVLFQCGSYQKALEAYEKACSWEHVFVCCDKLHLSSAETMEIARRVAGECFILVFRWQELCRGSCFICDMESPL